VENEPSHKQFDLLLKIGRRLEVWRVEFGVWVKLGAKRRGT